MKKIILVLSVFVASQASFGQLTSANEPQIGDNQQMYVVDTATVTLSTIRAISGATAVWDYSAVNISSSSLQSLVVGNATTDPNASSFSTSTKTMTQGTILSFFNSTSASRVSQGYVYDAGAPIGNVVAKFDTDDAIIMTYPYSYGSSLIDDFSGTATTSLGAFPFTGKVYSSIDGEGTLILPNGSYTGVFRYTSVDTVNATGVPFLGTVQLIRTQFEYYDLADQDLPIFIDATIEIPGVGRERQVLSKHLSAAGLNSNGISNLTLFPNPSNGEFSISGDFVKGNIEVSDLTGKTVYSSEIVSGSSVKMNDLKSGVYTVKISAEGKSSVQKITIK